ncbi:unnamed protein product [Staurois parvus]|uniref:Uncharacterized protein n=1 Tax=Staurois parvus TaxID=386267 RepID=A0ABN9B0T1_9NEOB|nr:unnamed protein product [Staurois parvus]
MHINGRTGAVQGWMAVYKHPPRFPACACSLGARSTAIRRPLCPPDTAEHRLLYGTPCVRSRSCDH